MKVTPPEVATWGVPGFISSTSAQIFVVPSRLNETLEMATIVNTFLGIFMYPFPAWKEILECLYKTKNGENIHETQNEIGSLVYGNPICIIEIDFGEKIDILLEDLISILEISIRYLEENPPF